MVPTVLVSFVILSWSLDEQSGGDYSCLAALVIPLGGGFRQNHRAGARCIFCC